MPSRFPLSLAHYKVPEILAYLGLSSRAWHGEDYNGDLHICRRPRKDQCGSPDLPVNLRCTRKKGHKGYHSCSYWHQGGLGCSSIWRDPVNNGFMGVVGPVGASGTPPARGKDDGHRS